MSLFWKIFGWFTVSQILIILATFIHLTLKGPPPSPPNGPPSLWMFFEWRRLLMLALIGTPISYVLARYLVQPAIRLRNATHQLASGDLSTRVASQMGNRRDELADMGKDFDMMAERIENLVEAERHHVEAQQRLLADISHELRSPLARLAYALDLAQDSADDATRSYLQRIERESARLNELIGQLLTLARLEAAPQGDIMVAPKTLVNFTRLVRDVCTDAEFEAQKNNVQVLLHADADYRVYGSESLLQSAVENVVRNALRHAPTQSAVEIALKADDDHVVVTVRDHGAGVPSQAVNELFRPFYRVESARDRETGGVGLGLSITQRAVQFHSGTVRAENAEGGGLRILVTLPLAQRKTN